jgi:hypothetical protein
LSSFNIFDKADITKVPADCLITGIGSNGWWINSGIDDTLIRLATANVSFGTATDRVVVYQHGIENAEFGALMLVTDDLGRDVYEIVLLALQEADSRGFGRLTIPALQGHILRSANDCGSLALRSIAHAVVDFRPNYVRDVTIVVNDDPEATRILLEELPV